MRLKMPSSLRKHSQLVQTLYSFANASISFLVFHLHHEMSKLFVQSKARFEFFSDSQRLIFQPVFFQFAADAKIIKKPPKKIEKRTIGKINSKVI